MVLHRMPRFRRAEEEARRPLHLTERDQAIVRLIHRHAFVRSHHITQLIPGSRQQILRRLQLLYHHGYLERPPIQIEYFRMGGGSQAIAYGLGSRGAALLRHVGKMPHTRLNWHARSRTAKRLFLEHALLTSDVMVKIEATLQQAGTLRFIDQSDLLCEQRNEIQVHHYRWSVRLPTQKSIGIIPDRVFALERVTPDGSPERVYYFLEADRSTMPVVRENLAQSSFYRKLIAYEASWEQDLHRTRLGIPRFRVLTVTTSPERAANIASACRSLNRGHGIFLFTDLASLLQSSNLLTFRWITAQGEPATLFS